MKPLIKILFAAVCIGFVASAAHALVGPAEEAADLAPHAVMVLKRSPRASSFCSATVLSRDVVLTAAHCVATLADTRIHFKDERGAPQLRDLAAIAIHPGFRADAIRARIRSIDLALVRLREALPNRFIPVTLSETRSLELGSKLRMAGFGVTREGDGKTAGTLRVGEISVSAPLSDTLLWLRDARGLGACTGDSGGGVFLPDRSLLVGIIDWAEGANGRQCGSLTQAVLIAPHRAWIENVLQGWQK
jgi:secreted trypsin-like serine protease